MVYHPDHNMQKSEAEIAECTERFKAILAAHQQLRKKHKNVQHQRSQTW